jgi:hypothetical protein
MKVILQTSAILGKLCLIVKWLNCLIVNSKTIKYYEMIQNLKKLQYYHFNQLQ